MELRPVSAIADVSPVQWDALAAGHPFLRHTFLQAFEATGCASPASGWSPHHLTLWDGNSLAGAVPLYEKTHSYGEFVFDWAWAEAYERAGLAYYPKLLTAVPFTPVQGPRFLARDARVRDALIEECLRWVHNSQASSWHVLFPTAEEAEQLTGRGLIIRRGVQFHWQNRGYRDFADFLDTLTRDKRKKIRQERRKVTEAGVSLRRLPGRDLQRPDWEFFYRCYCRTFYDLGRMPYLNLDFFLQVGAAMAENVLMVVAEQAGKPIAAALDVLDGVSLYGRYWGGLEFVSGLHFETCYYQGIEYCIEKGLNTFEGGAQGEHKLARGFEPEATLSAHWLRDPRFADAVARFLARESQGVDLYLDELEEHTPFK
ncbi:MAG: GNAT family N-acetyltransferase [Rhodocyclaceae bacterium]